MTSDPTTRVALETAIADLIDLLAEPEVPLESSMQSYFELHPIALTSLGFDSVLPHPRLEYADDAVLEPDFMAWAPDATTTVIEIKRALCSAVVLGPDRRPRESADLTKAISQGREYVSFFDDSANRSRFSETNALPCHKNPSLLVFIGRSEPRERLARLMLERDRSLSLVVKTYDELAIDLEAARRRNFGDREGLEGGSLHVLLRSHCDSGARGTVFSAGTPQDGRWRAWIEPGCELSLDMSPAGSAGASTLPSGFEVLLSFEFGSRAGFATAAIYIDGKLIAEADFYGDTPLPRLESLRGARIGASKFGDPGAPTILLGVSLKNHGRTVHVILQPSDCL